MNVTFMLRFIIIYLNRTRKVPDYYKGKAVEEALPRRISVKARAADNGYFSYEIENTKINDVRKAKEKVISDKRDKKSHGMGLMNVRVKML